MRAPLEIYRGWWVLAGLFLVYAASNGILMHTLPLTYPALLDEFGWDEAQVTLPATVLFIVAAFTSPPVGVLLDRYSPRLVIAAGSVAMVIGLLAFSRVTELWQLVSVYAVFAVALSMCGLVSTMLVLTRWFERLRGRATGILLLASSLGASVFPLILGASMSSFGWRGSLLVFATIAGLMTILPALVLIRDQPRPGENAIEFGDALNARADTGDGKHHGPTLRDALAEPRFYLIAIATGAIWLTVISLLQHQAIYLSRDVGIARDVLPAVFSTFFAFSVAGKLSFGWLSDRLDKGITLIVSIGVLVVSLGILQIVDDTHLSLVFLYAVIAGVGFSGAFTTIQLWIASFYAGHSYGKILAILALFDTLAGALGTRIAGQMRTQLDSYIPVINTMIVISFTAILCIAAIKYLDGRHAARKALLESGNYR